MTEKISLSVFITSYRDNNYLDKLLKDISEQNFPKNNVEILLLVAGNYSKNRAIKNIGNFSSSLKFWHIPKLNRTKSLNFLIEKSVGKYLIRLDARSHINKYYFNDIYKLHEKNKAVNIGGFKLPIALNPMQKKIAALMRHPFSFGGGKFRSDEYSGQVKTLYLGSFKRALLSNKPYDEILYKISEDTDLNYQLIKNGHHIILDNSIKVEYYPRENLPDFFKLCFNYGVGRGLFVIKNKIFYEPRQFLGIVLPLLCLILFFLSFFSLLYFEILSSIIMSYLFCCLIFSLFMNREKNTDIFIYIIGFIGCHFSWVMGFFFSFFEHQKLKR